MSKVRRHLIAIGVLGAACLGITVVPAAAAGSSDAAGRGAAMTYTGAFEFEGLAADGVGKACQGQGSFGEMKRGAKVTISERDAAGDFTTIATGKLKKGKFATSQTGERVCRMAYKAKAASAPAADSTIYLEIKNVTFDIQFPAVDVADGDLGTWICEFDDTACARVVG